MVGVKEILASSRNRIGRRLMLWIIGFSSVITLIITVVQLAIEYRELRDGLDRQFESINIYVPNIAASAWNFDDQQIRLALEGLIRLPNIERAAIVGSSNGARWSSGTVRSDTTVARTYPLRYGARSGPADVGTLEVTASLSAIYHQVIGRAVSILVSNAFKTFLVALFMMFLFRRMVTLRMEKLALKVAKLAPASARPPDGAELPPLPPNFDELHAVEWVLDHTSEDLSIASAALQDLNRELADQVAEKEALLDNALVGIVLLRDRKVATCNLRFEQMFGYREGSMLGQPAERLCRDAEEFRRIAEEAAKAFGAGASFGCSAEVRRRDGSTFWAELAGRPLGTGRAQKESIWIISDITERKVAEQRVEFVHSHDPLTELPNRVLARDRFQQALAAGPAHALKTAVICLDLDNFKTINDSLGHHAGDALIKEVALRMMRCVHAGDTVCRLGGDEFLIVLTAMPSADSAAPVLVRLQEKLNAPVTVEGHDLSTSASIGVAICPDDGDDFDALMKKAEIAMYRAKEAGRNTYRFFDEQMNVDAVEQLSMRNGLRRALERGEFVLHYQPQLELGSNALVGVEALIRWKHPELGMIPPGRFIPIAEHSGLIIPIGEWVLREACRQAVAWRRSGLGAVKVAVNLSALQFKRADPEQAVISALEETGMDPSHLELELTESILISDPEIVLAAVQRLKHLHVKLSIDDFGTGYSSLSYLKRFEVDKLKIDQSFVRDLATDPDDAAIVRAIVQLAHGLGLRAIAEGVESPEALAMLRSFGCDEAQGFLFARPMPAEELPKYLATLRAGG